MNVTFGAEEGSVLAAWAQAVLSALAIFAAIGLAYWQDEQRKRSERYSETVARRAAIGAVRLAAGHITIAAQRCQAIPRGAQGFAFEFPFYVLDQADQAIANFPLQSLGHEDGVEVFLGTRNSIASARIRLAQIVDALRANQDASAPIGALVNDARILRGEYRKIRQLLAPGTKPLDADHPAEID